jgi:primosomal protein N' (replication factor Y)
VRTLEKAGWVRLETVDAGADPLVEATKAPPASDPGAPPTLYPAQEAAVVAVTGAIERGGFAPFLLLGVTGSGKTEVYLRAIDACRARGRQAIVLVPEIALTPQTVRRFRARVPRVAVLHSAMTEADRANTWRDPRRQDRRGDRAAQRSAARRAAGRSTRRRSSSRTRRATTRATSGSCARRRRVRR